MGVINRTDLHEMVIYKLVKGRARTIEPRMTKINFTRFNMFRYAGSNCLAWGHYSIICKYVNKTQPDGHAPQYSKLLKWGKLQKSNINTIYSTYRPHRTNHAYKYILEVVVDNTVFRKTTS